jgi:hypothetical protein
MPKIIFSHPDIKPKDLVVDVGIDDCSWGYGMNTQTYPTYGGEVVQLLSVFVEDIELGGTVRSYEKMETIYAWFLQYMQNATQGASGTGSYDQTPIFMNYPTRNWTFHIHPTSLPGFRYGTEVVAPTWRLQGAVWEADDEVQAISLKAAVDGLKRVPLGIGYKVDNPFSDPMGDGKTTKKDLEDFYKNSVDKFSKLIPAYMDGDYESLLGDIGSKPKFATRTIDDESKGDQVKARGGS